MAQVRPVPGRVDQPVAEPKSYQERGRHSRAPLLQVVQWPLGQPQEAMGCRLCTVAEVGRETAERRWRAYPVLDYGEDWDPPGL